MHHPSLAERFVRVEFCDEDRPAYRRDGDVDSMWFLQQCVGSILRHGFELGGHAFEILAYSKARCRHTVWFVSLSVIL
jgi:RNA-dependent RNA polymerase